MIKKRLLRLRDFKDRDHGAKARQQYRQFQQILDKLQRWIGPIEAKTILDIGCGRFCPYTTLLNSINNKVFGSTHLWIVRAQAKIKGICFR